MQPQQAIIEIPRARLEQVAAAGATGVEPSLRELAKGLTAVELELAALLRRGPLLAGDEVGLYLVEGDNLTDVCGSPVLDPHLIPPDHTVCIGEFDLNTKHHGVIIGCADAAVCAFNEA